MNTVISPSRPSATTPHAAPRNTSSKRTREPRPGTRCEATQANKLLLLHHLQRRQIALATVTYEGGGDEGTTTGVQIVMVGADEVNPSINPPGELTTKVAFWTQDLGAYARRHALAFKLSRLVLEAALAETAWDLVIELHAGFQNGDGGAGDVRFHAGSQTVVVAHNTYFTASKFSETRV